jgi:hypothetical protein
VNGMPSPLHGGAALSLLFHAIVARDRPAAARLLDNSPALAREAARSGADRAHAREHFLEAIAHYAYAGDTALHIAAAAHDPGIVSDLIARGADPHARNRRGAEPLHYAADGRPGAPGWNAEAQAEVVRLLIAAGADPNAADRRGVMPLHRAVRTRSAAAVRALLAGGADPQRANGSGSTPLRLATLTTGKSGSGSRTAREQQAEIIAILQAAGPAQA